MQQLKITGQILDQVREIHWVICLFFFIKNTVKLGFIELLNKEQIVNSEPFPVTNLPVYLLSSERIGISDQFCDDQKIP